jgi:hypothetical protein
MQINGDQQDDGFMLAMVTLADDLDVVVHHFELDLQMRRPITEKMAGQVHEIRERAERLLETMATGG